MRTLTSLLLIGCVSMVTSQIIPGIILSGTGTVGSTSTPIVESTTQPQDACHYEKDAGPCKALFWRFYYDAQSDRCLTFAYGGCYGNDNNFISMEECQTACMGGLSNDQSFDMEDIANRPVRMF